MLFWLQEFLDLSNVVWSRSLHLADFHLNIGMQLWSISDADPVPIPAVGQPVTPLGQARITVRAHAWYIQYKGRLQIRLCKNLSWKLGIYLLHDIPNPLSPSKVRNCFHEWQATVIQHQLEWQWCGIGDEVLEKGDGCAAFMFIDLIWEDGSASWHELVIQT